MTALPEDFGRWLAAARDGSRDALGCVLEACRRYLLYVAQRELNGDLQAKGGASDLVQDTFLEAQCAFDRFHGHSETELRAWLRQLLHHRGAKFRRRYQTTQKRRLARDGAPGGQVTRRVGPRAFVAERPADGLRTSAASPAGTGPSAG